MGVDFMHPWSLVCLARPLRKDGQCGTHGIRWSHTRCFSTNNIYRPLQVVITHFLHYSILKNHVDVCFVTVLILGIPAQPANDGSR